MITIRRTPVLRRQWPYWNWVIWESSKRTPTVIVIEGLAFRRKTALKRARDFIAAWDRQDRALADNLRATEHE